MAIATIPGWIGSSAVAETGERWMSAARRAVRLSPSGWMSEMAGRSKEILVTLNGSNNGFSSTWLVEHIEGLVNGNITGHVIKIVITSGTTLINDPSNLEEEVIYIPDTWGACTNIIIENHGRILGRGGNGGGQWRGGEPGYHAIQNDLGTKLIIRNHGIIAGGGGGGSSAHREISGGREYGGGGGAPLGLGGRAPYANGNNASIDNPGSGAEYAGKGGGWGQNGANDSYSGGKAGMAVRNKAPTWEVRGTIYGAVP
ncbi:receptor-recognizing protein [Edwardsiella tarda]|uniref:Receptor-recognizing protein n=2 Tax=Edwardsiella tarda TaxID=636 RepID=A0A2A7U7H4_EDWTA|nr:receptor-recognizing protein [Edwardsiella tarda]PEH74290.1 receptor-recognizing protein [Edwardsiella tarda]